MLKITTKLGLITNKSQIVYNKKYLSVCFRITHDVRVNFVNNFLAASLV